MNEAIYDKIEAYLGGNLDAQTVQTFEADIKANTQLAQQVRIQRFERDAMEVLLEKDLRHDMASWYEDEAASTTVLAPKTATVSEKKPLTTIAKSANNRRWFYTLAAAASVALLSVAAWWLYKKNTLVQEPTVVQNNQSNIRIDTPNVSSTHTPPQYPDQSKPKNDPLTTTKPKVQPNRIPLKNVDNNDVTAVSSEESTRYANLAEENYQLEPPSFGSRDASTRESIHEKAVKAYNRQDYNNVVTILKNQAATDDNFEDYQILAHAYFQLKQYDKAVNTFETVLKLGGNAYRQTTEWYLLLSYLGDYKKYASQFNGLSEEIVSQNSKYAKDVKQLLEKMKTQ